MSEINDKAADNSVREGAIVPWGTPATYALVFKTNRDSNGTLPLHLTFSAVWHARWVLFLKAVSRGMGAC